MTWVKGQSGNPKGRPPSTTALAEYIRTVIEPKELAEIAITIARNTQVAEKERLAAVKFLADHGWSKPVVSVVIEPTANPLDLSTMTTEELLVLERLDAAQPREDDNGDAPKS